MDDKGFREGYLSVNGGKIWFRIAGTAAGGIPLLLLHGGPGAPHDYQEPLEQLSDERPVIFYDQLGCGNSDRPLDKSLWTIGHFVEEIETVRRELGLERLHILGQSWGSMLAVDYMLSRSPRGILSLILSGPCLSASRWESDQRAYLGELPEEARKAIYSAEASGNFDSPEYQQAMTLYYNRYVCRLDPWPECLSRAFQKFGSDVYKYMWGPSEFTVTGTLKGFERAGRLKEIKVPVLFTCGRFDEATPATTAYYQSMLPGSEMAIFEGASHSHHLEKTGEFIRVVRDFLSRAEAKRSR
jgi:proline iminopeptidase